MFKKLRDAKFVLMAGTAMALASGAAMATPTPQLVCMIDPIWGFCFDYLSFAFCCGLFGL